MSRHAERWARMTPEQRDHAKRRNREYLQRVKAEVVQAYGGRCACCGNGYLPHMTMDHINEDGKMDPRRKGGRGNGNYFYATLRRMLPVLDPTLQVLCFNCNSAKHVLGRCGCSDA